MKFSEKLTYLALTAICGALSVLPLRVLYIFSDFLAWLAHSVVKYRVKVVRENLASAFPEKTEEERRKIEKEFYRFLGDYFFETVKLFSMSYKFIRLNLKLECIEQIDRAMAN